MSLTLNPPLADLATDAVQGLKDQFDADATVTAAAPGRVNLIGEHIDYCDGFVLPFAIERYVVIAARPNGLDTMRMVSSTHPGERLEVPLQGEIRPAAPAWGNYVRGVLHGFRELGHQVPGFDAFLSSTIPLGAGLSSSAALELAVATTLEGLLDTVLPTRDKALLCRQAEHDFAGCPCGIMDQFASAYGQANRLVLIDCQSGEPELVHLDDPNLTVLVANTMVSHELNDGGYARRRKDTEDGLAILGKNSWRDVTMDEVEANWDKLGDPVNRRARHVVGEIARTRDAAEALERNSIDELGPLMAASHNSLRDDFEVSCRELDIMVEIARMIGRKGGVIGSRMTGGGFGGSTVTLCESDHAESIARTLEAEYRNATGIAPEIFPTRPARGAHLIAP